MSARPANTNMIEPTPDECVEMQVVGDAILWVGFTKDEVNNPESPARAFLTLFEQANDAIREFAAMSKTDVDTELDAWQYNGKRVTIGMRAKAHLIIHAIKIAAGVEHRAAG